MRATKAAVNNYLQALPEDMEEFFLSIRDVVLAAAPSAREEIKWKNCLTYVIAEKNAIQTVLGKDKVTLIFHQGELIRDTYDLLEGEGKVRSYRITKESFNKAALKNYVKQVVALLED
jgi:hypothetical protein